MSGLAPFAPSGGHREHRLGVGELGRQDHLDVVVLHLQVHRARAGVLAVLEFGRAVGHEVAGPGAGRQRLDDLRPSVAAARSSASASSIIAV